MRKEWVCSVLLCSVFLFVFCLTVISRGVPELWFICSVFCVSLLTGILVRGHMRFSYRDTSAQGHIGLSYGDTSERGHLCLSCRDTSLFEHICLSYRDTSAREHISARTHQCGDTSVFFNGTHHRGDTQVRGQIGVGIISVWLRSKFIVLLLALIVYAFSYSVVV